MYEDQTGLKLNQYMTDVGFMGSTKVGFALLELMACRITWLVVFISEETPYLGELIAKRPIYKRDRVTRIMI